MSVLTNLIRENTRGGLITNPMERSIEREKALDLYQFFAFGSLGGDKPAPLQIYLHFVICNITFNDRRLN